MGGPTPGSEVKVPVTTSQYICVEPVAVGPSIVYVMLKPYGRELIAVKHF
jgi:hypothetical protein